MNGAFGPADLTWREAFWRICALAFVKFRLRNDPPRHVIPPGVTPHSRD